MKDIENAVTPSTIVQHYSHARAADGFISFLSAALTALSISEMLGPLIGWPTITALCFSLGHFESKQPSVPQMVLVLLPQLALTFFSVWLLTSTPWPTLVYARVTHNPSILVSGTHPRETGLGVLAGIVVASLLGFTLTVPARDGWALPVAELVLIAIAIAALIIYVRFPPKKRHFVTTPDPSVFLRLPISPAQIELVLDPTHFQKTIVLRELPHSWELLRGTNRVIGLHAADHIFLNLGELEKQIRQELEKQEQKAVKVSSVNLFTCTGYFSTTVHPVGTDSGFFEDQGVDYLINNLYTRPDLFTFLRSRLSLTMNTYVGELDKEVKTLVESFNRDHLESELRTSTRVQSHTSSSAPLNSTESTKAQLRFQQERTKATLERLTTFESRWKEARRLQENAKTVLPDRFKNELCAHFQEVLDTNINKAEAKTSISRLLRCASIEFHLETFDFTTMATEAESLVKSKLDEAKSALADIQARVHAEDKSRTDEIRDLIHGPLKNITLRDLTSPRLKRQYLELMSVAAGGVPMVTTDELKRLIREIETEAKRPALGPKSDDSMESSGVDQASGPFDSDQSDPPLGAAATRAIVDQHLKAISARVLRSTSCKKLIDAFVVRWSKESEAKVLSAVPDLIVQLSSLEVKSDEPF
jgi:hypothetical protein